jgi:hypothetical protein
MQAICTASFTFTIHDKLIYKLKSLPAQLQAAVTRLAVHTSPSEYQRVNRLLVMNAVTPCPSRSFPFVLQRYGDGPARNCCCRR